MVVSVLSAICIVVGGFLLTEGYTRKSRNVMLFASVLVLGSLVGGFAVNVNSQDWDERTARELSEHCGVEVTPEVLQTEKVKERISNKAPSYAPLNTVGGVTRDEGKGTFAVADTGEELYLFVDGEVLEVMTRQGGDFLPYDAAVASSAGSTKK